MIRRSAIRRTRSFLSRHPALTILLTTLICLVLLVLGTEFALRVTVGANDEQEALLELMRARAIRREDIQLENPPSFLTDEYGIWVANPQMPGINDDGYRSPPFDAKENGRPKIMMLGDSFTYGLTASNVANSFAGRVRGAGYRVYNLGIPGTGVGQYLAQARVYVPKLKPDVVAVILYPGDDFQIEPPVRPGLNRNHMSNYGLLPALTSAGEPIPYDDAVDSFIGFMSDDFSGRLIRFGLSTAIARFAMTNLLEDKGYLGDIPATRQQLLEIKAIATANGAKLLLFVLPVRETYLNSINDRTRVITELAELHPLAPGPYDEDSLYAPMPDPHFNDAGHARFATFIIDELGKAGFAGNDVRAP